MGVRYVLEGNLRRDGDQVRIKAQLIDAISNNRLWDRHYDRTMANIIALQGKVIGEIASTVPIDFTAAPAAEPELADPSL